MKESLFNMGGRKLLNERMVNHYTNLANIGPSMTTREKPFVHCSTKQKRREKGKKPHMVTETHETFRRVEASRKEVDSGRPATAKLCARLSASRKANADA